MRPHSNSTSTVLPSQVDQETGLQVARQSKSQAAQVGKLTLDSYPRFRYIIYMMGIHPHTVGGKVKPMPVCFQLSRKESEKFTPVKLPVIDDEMCREFRVEPDEVKYYYDWYGSIGIRLACGKSFDEIIQEFTSRLDEAKLEGETEWLTEMIRIAKWLDENFVANGWRQ